MTAPRGRLAFFLFSSLESGSVSLLLVEEVASLLVLEVVLVEVVSLSLDNDDDDDDDDDDADDGEDDEAEDEVGASPICASIRLRLDSADNCLRSLLCTVGSSPGSKNC